MLCHLSPIVKQVLLLVHTDVWLLQNIELKIIGNHRNMEATALTF